MAAPRMSYYKAMITLMRYIVATRNRGLTLAPHMVWNGNSKFKFKIHGRSDSDYAANTDDRRSISGGRVFVNQSLVVMINAAQKSVTLSVTEAEGASGVTTAQDMMYIYRTLASVGLSVELPMVLEMDNQGAVHLANNWSV